MGRVSKAGASNEGAELVAARNEEPGTAEERMKGCRVGITFLPFATSSRHTRCALAFHALGLSHAACTLFLRSHLTGAMARGPPPLDGGVLPPSRIVRDKQAGLPRKFMPALAGREAVILGEARPAPHYPARSAFFLSFTMAAHLTPTS